MTGFGRGNARQEDVSAVVEIRSVNSRYCEVQARLPNELAAHETTVQNRIKEAFARGRFNVQVKVERYGEDSLSVQVDVDTARGYGKLLRRLAEAAGIEAPVQLDDILTFSDVFVSAEASEETVERTWQVVQAALGDAIEQLGAMRRQEGAALREDLDARRGALAALLDQVERRAPLRVEEARQRMHARVNELLEDERFDRDRLELEIAILADKLDVTEECVRLRSHLNLLDEALAGDEPAGRKLNFLAQEINREVNTIGSKSNDAAVAHLAVQMKEELEKIREQIQNVE